MRKLYGVVLFISLFYTTLLASGFKDKEKHFFENIKVYSKDDGYLNSEELKTLSKLKKEKLVMGYEADYDVDSVVFKKIIEKHLGIDVILVSKPWNELLEGLKSGEIHILANLSYVKSRSEYIKYSKPYQSDAVYLLYSEDETLNSFENLRGKDVFYTKGSVHATAFKQLKTRYDVDLIPREVLELDKFTENTYMISDRLIIYSIIQQGLTNLRYSELFNTDPLFVGVSKKLPEEYSNLLEKVMNNYINVKLSDYLNTYSNYLNSKFMINVLTKEERSYLRLLEEPALGIDKNQFYISYTDKNDGEYKGSWIDIANEWKKLSKNVRLVPLGSKSEKVNFLDENINGMTLMPISWKINEKYNVTPPLYSIEYFMVENKYTNKKGLPTGIPRDSYYMEKFLDQNIDGNYIIYNDSLETVEALEKNKVSSIILSENEMRYFQNEMLKTFLNLQKGLGIIHLGAATNSENKLLLGILTTYVKYSENLNNIIKQWEHSPNLVGIKYKQKNKILYTLVIILFIFIVSLIYSIKKLYRSAYYDQTLNIPNMKFLKKTLKEVNTTGLITISLRNSAEILDISTEEEIAEKTKELIAVASLPVYRINKNEYAIVAEKKTQDEVFEYLDKVIKATNNLYFSETKLQFNYGAAHMSTSKSTLDLIKNALYSMHLYGSNNKLILGDPKVLEAHRSYKRLELKLEKAIKSNDYTPNFQPKISIGEKKIKGAEILSRFISSDEGFISPGVFVPILENLDLIHKLDMQMLEKSLMIIKVWLDNGIVERDFIISQNLSVKTLENEEISNEIIDIIEKTEFPTENLEFEVTETAFSNNMDVISLNLSKIRSLGIMISLDDFSAGNSSVSYITKLPIDTIKFDMSILPASEDEIAGINIFTSFSDTFKNLGYKIVAEGVETKWQKDFLTRTNVNEAQGYYYSKPLNEKAFEGWVENYTKTM